MGDLPELPETDKIERRKQASVFKDARVDRWVTWALGSLATILVGVVLSYARGIDEKLNVYGTTLAELQKDVAVLKDEKREMVALQKTVDKLEDRLRALEIRKP